MFTHSKKWVRKIKKLHVAVVQQWLRNGQNCVMDVKRLLFCQSKLSCCCRGWLLLKLQYLLRSRNFATMGMWGNSSALYKAHTLNNKLASAEQSISGTWTFWLASIIKACKTHHSITIRLADTFFSMKGMAYCIHTFLTCHLHSKLHLQ